MIILACETSTLLGSVAIVKDGVVVSYTESYRKSSHSEVLNLFVENCLLESKIKLQDIDLFVSGVGPGSFTGIRISVNTIKSFAYCFSKPCLGIDSLSNLAQQFVALGEINSPIVCMINAYKNMVYVATFVKDASKMIVLKAPEVVRVQNLQSYIQEPSYVVGDGYLAYQSYFDQHLSSSIKRLVHLKDEPNAKFLAELAFHFENSKTIKWNELVPVYLRESEAEENAKGIKYQPLF